METQTKTCKKEIILRDVVVEADLSNMLWRNQWKHTDTKKLAQDLERAIKEFEAFLRDHRSQDLVRLIINRQYENICSACKNRWEIYEENEKIYCAYCGAIVES